MKAVIFVLSLMIGLMAARNQICHQAADYGNCRGYQRLWAYSRYENMCVSFVYSGCGGNENRFTSKNTCEKTCS